MRIRIPEGVVVPEYVWGIDRIEMYMDKIEGLLKTRVATDNIELLSEQLGELIAWYEASANVVASAKFYYESAFKYEYEMALERIKKSEYPPELRGMTSASVVRDYIKSRCAGFIWMVEKSDRLNRGLTHAVDAIRTLISKEKELRRTAPTQQNVSAHG